MTLGLRPWTLAIVREISNRHRRHRRHCRCPEPWSLSPRHWSVAGFAASESSAVPCGGVASASTATCDGGIATRYWMDGRLVPAIWEAATRTFCIRALAGCRIVNLLNPDAAVVGRSVVQDPAQVHLAGLRQLIGFGIEVILVQRGLAEPAVRLLDRRHVQHALAIGAQAGRRPAALVVVDVGAGHLGTGRPRVGRPFEAFALVLPGADGLRGPLLPPGFAVPTRFAALQSLSQGRPRTGGQDAANRYDRPARHDEHDIPPGTNRSSCRGSGSNRPRRCRSGSTLALAVTGPSARGIAPGSGCSPHCSASRDSSSLLSATRFSGHDGKTGWVVVYRFCSRLLRCTRCGRALFRGGRLGSGLCVINERHETTGALNYMCSARDKGCANGAQQNGALTTKAQSHEARDEETEFRSSTVKFPSWKFPLCLRVFVVNHPLVGESGSSTFRSPRS